ncbi:hypothetical protein ACF090_34190 [Streptomyces sp. NPDC014892]|uniref:hypothetical protein n=1 Tax=Streptomyces sp. NPDC014892 TaxID=3364930 RepID=UPI003701E036
MAGPHPRPRRPRRVRCAGRLRGARLLPWDAFDVLFLAGSTEWKLGAVAERLAREAKARGKGVHMGRVNSRTRLGIAEWFGCDSADGTYLAYGPDRNLPRLLRWIDELDGRPSLVGTLTTTPPLPPPPATTPRRHR